MTATVPDADRMYEVPAAAVRPDGALNRDGVFERGSAGCGAGTTEDEATGAGLLSALAHRGLVAALRGEEPPGTLRPPDTGDGALAFLLRAAARLDRDVTLLDLPGAAPGHAVAALASSPGEEWALGYGRDRDEAALRALRDLVGTLQLADPAGVDLGDPLLPGVSPEALCAAATGHAAAERPAVAGPHLAPSGWETLVVSTAPQDLRPCGLHTVRVLLLRSDGEPS